MLDHPNVAIFWDYENCSPPSNTSGLGYDIVNNIRRIARLFGSVTTFRAYLDVAAQSPKSVTLRSELQSSGVSIIDCPHNGKKDVVDKMILVDMLAFAVDHPAPATVFLITGDRDYSYAVSILRLRKYQVILVVPSPQTSPCLESQASIVIDWGAAILKTRTETVNSMPAIRQHYLDLDPSLTAKLLRELQELTLDDSDTTLLQPYTPASPSTSRVRRTSARDLLEQSKHSKNTGSIDSTQELGYSQGLPKRSTTAGNDSVPGGVLVPKTPSRSRCPSVSTESTRARSATTVAQDIPPKNPPPSSARQSCLSDITDVTGSAKHSLPVFPSSLDALEIPLHDNRPPSSINIRSPFKPVQPTGGLPDTSSTNKLNCLASPFVMTKAPTSLGSITNPSSKQIQAAIKPTSPIMSQTKTLVEAVTNVYKIPQIPAMVVPTETDHVTSLCVESDGEYTERPIPRRVLTKEGAPDATDTPVSDYRPYAASSASSGNVGLHLTKTPSSDVRVSLPAVSYLGTGEGIDPAQFQFAAFSRASSALDHSTRGFGSVPSSSSALPSTSFTTTESHEHDESERRQTWTMFKPLIHLLLAARERGIARPSRSTIAVELIQSDKQVYRHAGVLKFRDYTALAERAGIIELGGIAGDAWIALHPNWFDLDGVTTAHFLSNRVSSPMSDPPKVVLDPLSTGTKTSLTESPVVFRAPTSAPPKPNSFGSSNTLPTAATDPHDSTSIPARFQPLIDILIRLRAEGTYTILRSLVGQLLSQDVYAQAGVSGFKEYIQQASDAQIIQFGGTGGHAWIYLDPELRI